MGDRRTSREAIASARAIAHALNTQTEEEKSFSFAQIFPDFTPRYAHIMRDPGRGLHAAFNMTQRAEDTASAGAAGRDTSARINSIG